MAIDLRQNFRLTQQLLMTPHLQQAIKLLQLSRFELCEFVNKQLLENPVLEEVLSPASFDQKESIKDNTISAQEKNRALQDKFKKELRNADEYSFVNKKDIASFPFENVASDKKSLSEHLLHQIGCSHLSETHQKTAILLIGNIDERGYLGIVLDEFCKKEKVELREVEYVLDVIQQLEPTGVCARSLEECLLLQLEDMGEKNPIVMNIISDHLQDLIAKNYLRIAKKLNRSVGEVMKCVAVIAGLEPMPARNYGPQSVQYIIPDIYVYRVNNKWKISLNKEGLPNLRLSEYYVDLEEKLDKGLEKDYLSDHIKSASWLIKSLEQRQFSIYRVMEGLLIKQKDFFEKGIQFLKPMVLKEIAEIAGVHESTVSRVTNKKYVQTPEGIVELKFFFNRAISSVQGGVFASEYVRSMIKDMVNKEDINAPYTDNDLVILLKQKGVDLARRTVAKYRESLGFASSQKRKRFL